MEVEGENKVVCPEEEVLEKERETRMAKAMMDDLGVSRKNDLPLDNGARGRGCRNLQPPGKIKIIRELEFEERKIVQDKPAALEAWKAARFDDVGQFDVAIDELGSGQSHRKQMVAGLRDQVVVRGVSLYRGGRGGASSRGGRSQAVTRVNSAFSRGRPGSKIAPRGASMVATHIGSQSGRHGGITTSPRGSAHHSPRKLGRTTTTRLPPPQPNFRTFVPEEVSQVVAPTDNGPATKPNTHGTTGPTVVARKQVFIDKKTDGVLVRLGQGSVRITIASSDDSVPKILDIWILGDTVFEVPLVTEFVFHVQSSTVSFSSNASGRTVDWLLTFPLPWMAKNWGEVLKSNKAPAKVSTPTASFTRASTSNIEGKEDVLLISLLDENPGQQSPSTYGSDMMSLMGDPVLEPIGTATDFEMMHASLQTSPLTQVPDQVNEHAAADCVFTCETKPHKAFLGGLASSRFAAPLVNYISAIPSGVEHQTLQDRTEYQCWESNSKFECALHRPNTVDDPSSLEHILDPLDQLSTSDSALFARDRAPKEPLKLRGLRSSTWASPQTPEEMACNVQSTSTAKSEKIDEHDLDISRCVELNGKNNTALEDHESVSAPRGLSERLGNFNSRRSNESTETVKSSPSAEAIREPRRAGAQNWLEWPTSSSDSITSSISMLQAAEIHKGQRSLANEISEEESQDKLAVITKSAILFDNVPAPQSRKPRFDTASSQILSVKPQRRLGSSVYAVDTKDKAKANLNLNNGSPATNGLSALKPTAIDFSPSSTEKAHQGAISQPVTLWVAFNPPLQPVTIRWDDESQPGKVREVRGLLQTGTSPLERHVTAHITAVVADDSRFSENIAPQGVIPAIGEALMRAETMGSRQPLIDRGDNAQDVQKNVRARLRQSLAKRQSHVRGASSG